MIRKGTLREQTYVASLFIKLLGGEELPPGEMAYLKQWAKRSPQHQATYDDLSDRKTILQKLQALLTTDARKKRVRFEQQPETIKDIKVAQKDKRQQKVDIILHGKIEKRSKGLSATLPKKNNVKSINS